MAAVTARATQTPEAAPIPSQVLKALYPTGSSTTCEEAFILPTLQMRQLRPRKVQQQETTSSPDFRPMLLTAPLLWTPFG